MATSKSPPQEPEPEQAVEPVEPPRCVNCGATATQRTTNPGADVNLYCDKCAGLSYPDGASLELINAPAE